MDLHRRKKQFIERQVEYLNHPLQPPKHLRLPVKQDNLNPEHLQQVFHRLSFILRKHTRLNFSHQAIEHVASQLVKLYEQKYQSIDSRYLSPEFFGQLDWSDVETLENLPEVWPFELPLDQTVQSNSNEEAEKLVKETQLASEKLQKEYQNKLLRLIAVQKTIAQTKSQLQAMNQLAVSMEQLTASLQNIQKTSSLPDELGAEEMMLLLKKLQQTQLSQFEPSNSLETQIHDALSPKQTE
ncbi:Sim4 and Mal2 associated protein 4 [Schizosaccharomyces japonicus yFS275]|uniref:Sim4 and Mal2 associated protein 4 n=1 Tax=Schizosaccharomyces japonicus (strain yFS275 / FY16936) TaxID=402676 RepID=B6K6C6_SCHJY|nr:Sim4 and Mal2 associated protein 4 [Schizosaccharomyces japonicus yFS275]EEB09080.1 Sim4 and Mal2 associated protein 4 [Schizosaccharomyces japonicus yFS275]